MAATLHHRGPGGLRLHGVPGVGLGVQRLAIVDLTTGDQFIGNEDDSVQVVLPSATSSLRVGVSGRAGVGRSGPAACGADGAVHGRRRRGGRAPARDAARGRHARARGDPRAIERAPSGKRLVIRSTLGGPTAGPAPRVNSAR